MCCGMGHISGLVTDIIKAELRAGYTAPAYNGSAYQKAYQAQQYSIEQGGIEKAMGKELVSYELSFDKQGDVVGYMVQLKIPGYANKPSIETKLAADPNKTGVMLYDAESKEVINVEKIYDGDVKNLRSQNQEHWVISPQALQREVVRNMFNKPAKQEVVEYGSQIAKQDPAQQKQADYSARSDLRNKIQKKKQELGVAREVEHQLRNQEPKKVMYN